MKKRYLAVSGIIFLAAAVCAGIGIWRYLQQQDAGDGYSAIRTEVGSGIIPRERESPESVKVEIPIDFDALQARNPDVYAWIAIPGTAIDYPVLQSETDNTYYLTHTIDGAESPEGSIYTETYNSRDFEDPNTVIYGHDMANGSMIQNLLSYQDKSFFEANREVLVYTPDAIRHYRIFAAYVYDDRHLMQSFNFEDKEIYRQYLESVFSIREMGAYIDSAQTVTEKDKIITLSTCYGNQADRRYLVQAVLISIEK